ncbi:MAG: fluoride efflux transporter CrcB [Spirochaetes bacterium]|nr:fluoride efflux transporter CrcB [Spirochaetota bacterium]
MTKFLAVAAGGSIGASLRYFISLFFINHTHLKFPYATFIVNLSGCFLIGLFYSFFSERVISVELRLFIITGFLGALTTFSTYNFENLMLMKEKFFITGIVYFLLSNAAGILLIAAGIRIGNLFK